MASVDQAQRLLVDVSGLCFQATSAASALSALSKRERGRDSVDAISKLERLVQRAEQSLAKLEKEDARLREALREALKSDGSARARARKLDSDYRRRVDVAAARSAVQAALRESRFATAELRKRAAEEQRRAARAAKQTSTSLAPELLVLEDDARRAELLHRQQAQLAVREFDDSATQELERTQLESIARDCALVQEMASEVGGLLVVQDDDISRLEDNSEAAVASTLQGVHELSQARKRQAGSGATKTTFGTATVGGLVGILGGPVGIAIGAAAGGLVGLVAGKGVAAVKRRSIEAETRRVKALLALRQAPGGDYAIAVQVFELQVWSYVQRRWQAAPTPWVDEFGLRVEGATPEADLSAPEARLHLLAAARRAGGGLSPEDEAEVVRVHEQELALDIVWRWAAPRWQPDATRKGADLGGWDYAPSADAERWAPEPARGCIVRRRLWTRQLIGAPRTNSRSDLLRGGSGEGRRDAGVKHGTGTGTGEGNTKSPSSTADHTRHLWGTIHASTTTTNEIVGESLLLVNRQGEKVCASHRNATVVGDTADLTERIDRASHLSGALKNMFTWPRGKMTEADDFARELEARRQASEEHGRRMDEQRAAQARAQAGGQRPQREPDDLADETSARLQDTLRMSKALAGELDAQNAHLDATASAVDRANAGIAKVTKRLRC